MKRKKRKKPPKPRGVWHINPKTRVKPSVKIYRRAKEKQKKRGSIDRLDFPSASRT